MQVVILIPCSERKFIKPDKNMCAQHLTTGPIGHVAHAWGMRMRSTTHRFRPNEIYCGRAYQEGRKAANCLNAELIVISAGYGIVKENDEIAPYSLTVSTGKLDSISRKVNRAEWSLKRWWKMLGENTPATANLSQLLAHSDPDLILNSLSTRYTGLIQDELTSISSKLKQRMRLFCSATNPYVPTDLVDNIMPYDVRFNGPDSPIRGTMSDFSCRAAHHFAQSIQSGMIRGVNLDEDKFNLLDMMKTWTPPNLPHRIRQTDEEVIEFILNSWHQTGGLSGNSLRHLRNSGFACEQGRFRNLFKRAVDRCNLSQGNDT